MSVTNVSPEPPPLFAAREPIFPRRVSGRFRTLKWWIMAVTLGIYYAFPWLRWDRGPALPDQAVLVDLANRRFYFFFIEIWPQEFYLVAGLLIMAGLGLFLFTSALGRVWCGYTCPQTVWTDLFILVERWIEGDRNARVRLWNAPWTATKIRLRTLKWTIWLLIAVATGGAWVFYFADAPTLLGQLVTFSAPPVAYMSIAILTGTTFVLGGFLREQVCIYMCPWPRIQAAMMDEATLTVAYRDWRGEPRGKHRKAEGADQLGDCIDCHACVNVCPTGVDIREGQQLGCITCALCIDACDDVMARIGKPRGLIDYVTLADEERERAGEPPVGVWRQVLRPRVLVYTGLWARHRRRHAGGAAGAHRHGPVGRADPQPALRHAVRRLDPQQLRAAPAQHDRLRPRLPDRGGGRRPAGARVAGLRRRQRDGPGQRDAAPARLPDQPGRKPGQRRRHYPGRDRRHRRRHRRRGARGDGVPREAAMTLTGRRVFAIAAGIFVVMLVPNVVLAVLAVRTFSGLVVSNSYVASQEFDRTRAAQAALGWTATVNHIDGELRLDLTGAAGEAVRPATLAVTVGRPTTDRDDRTLALVETPAGYAADAALPPGGWRVEIAATAADGTAFRQSRDLRVR